MLRQVYAHVFKGDVSRARECLAELWEGHRPARDEAILIAVLQASIGVAAIYEWATLSFDILEQAEAALRRLAPPGGPALSSAISIRATRARLEYNTISHGAADEFFHWFHRLSRKHTGLWTPSIYGFRLVAHMNGFRHDDFDDLIRRPPLPQRAFSPLDAGWKLYLLGRRLDNEARVHEASIVFRASARKLLEAERTPQREYLGTRVLLRLATSLASRGEHAESEALVAEAAAMGEKLASPGIMRHVRFNQGLTLRDRGRHEEAMGVFLDVLNWTSSKTATPRRRQGRGRTDRTELDTRDVPRAGSRGHAVLLAAASAILCNRFSVAENLLARAKRELSRDSSHRAFVLSRSLRAQLELLRGTSRSLQRARRAIRAAGAVIHEKKWFRTLLNAQHTINCGWLALADGNVPEALRCATEAHALSRQRRDAVFEAQSLYLQSALLLEKSAPRTLLYDRTINRLGAINDPHVLFKVVANLYLYTWELDEDNLDLTDLHLKQISRMRDRLGEDRFRKLYDEHVAAPLMSRFRKRLLGT